MDKYSTEKKIFYDVFGKNQEYEARDPRQINTTQKWVTLQTTS